MTKIRPLAICLFRHEEKILVAQGYDPLKDQTFYRPLGGQIEFGEYSTDTIVREMKEEIGAEVRNLVYLGALENIFVFNGAPGHEIVLVYDGELTTPGLYGQAVISGQEAEIGESFDAMWKGLDEFHPQTAPLYPDGLAEMLRQ